MASEILGIIVRKFNSFSDRLKEKHEQIFWLMYLIKISDGKFVFIKADPFSQEMAKGT